MLVLCARAAAGDGGADKYRGILLTILIAGAYSALGGCTASPPAASLAAAADPGVPVPAARYSSVTAPYTPQRPVEPAHWLERNQRVAPQSSQ